MTAGNISTGSIIPNATPTIVPTPANFTNYDDIISNVVEIVQKASKSPRKQRREATMDPQNPAHSHNTTIPIRDQVITTASNEETVKDNKIVHHPPPTLSNSSSYDSLGWESGEEDKYSAQEPEDVVPFREDLLFIQDQVSSNSTESTLYIHQSATTTIPPRSRNPTEPPLRINDLEKQFEEFLQESSALVEFEESYIRSKLAEASINVPTGKMNWSEFEDEIRDLERLEIEETLRV